MTFIKGKWAKTSREFIREIGTNEHYKQEYEKSPLPIIKEMYIKAVIHVFIY